MNELVEEARPLATAGTGAMKERVIIITKRSGKKTFPPLCSRCIHREEVDQFGDPHYCGLMVEAKREGVPIWSCSHFKKVVHV